ncbi:MAG TPA: NifU family protein [Amycolatopsis sp.]|uniref:NifU family protein n=1 Tax=Amycolatopsis sp. TaxID=37632 RepID=UPI002B48DC47|nr:NifU family protein [Amycolatopsis sp.]HKS50025.1 NifU family protein [Amycolatopsis sp.]
MPEHAARLRDDEVAERLARLDDLLGQVEATPGPTGELALAAVTELSHVYGEALTRATGYVAGTPALDHFVRDELLGHLLVLHDIHPDPVDRRVARAIEELRPAVADRGGEVELAGIDGGAATVRLSISGCAAAGVRDAIREAVLGVAPELSEVTMVAGHRTAFVPLESLSAGVRS